MSDDVRLKNGLEQFSEIQSYRKSSGKLLSRGKKSRSKGNSDKSYGKSNGSLVDEVMARSRTNLKFFRPIRKKSGQTDDYTPLNKIKMRLRRSSQHSQQLSDYSSTLSPYKKSKKNKKLGKTNLKFDQVKIDDDEFDGLDNLMLKTHKSLQVNNTKYDGQHEESSIEKIKNLANISEYSGDSSDKNTKDYGQYSQNLGDETMAHVFNLNQGDEDEDEDLDLFSSPKLRSEERRVGKEC